MSSQTRRFEDVERVISWEEWLQQLAAAWPGSDSVRIDASLFSTREPHIDTLRSVRRIVIHIDNHTDGRAFSLARVLRERVGFQGELVVSGDYLPDQVPFLRRCGFDGFAGDTELHADQEYYSSYYQPGTGPYGLLEIRRIRLGTCTQEPLQQ